MNRHLSFEHFSTIPPVESAMQDIEPGHYTVETTVDIIPMQFIDNQYYRFEKPYTLKSTDKE